MKYRICSALSALFLILPAMAGSSDNVLGASVTFQSPNGVTERCIRITPMPGATYSDKDLETEQEYCSIDLYAETVALCPKTWSTSPGMIVYDISTGPYQGDRAGFERSACSEGKGAEDLAKDELAKFKPTMNAKGTSGTFSPSPLLYYHFSRFLEADIGVPPAVWRSMDRQAHLSEVARAGVAISGHSHSSGMNYAGWQKLVEADNNPQTYAPTEDLFTSDLSAVYGVLLKSPGSRYNSEVNGTRKSGWGKGQNNDFQETAPFLALRSGLPLTEAVKAGVSTALKDPQIKKDMGDNVAQEQIVYWMADIANIALLDFIFSQQDRVGNIDYTPYWVWVEDDKIRDRKATTHGEEAEAPPLGAIRIKRTHLNDNDAGARVEYANFAKSTEMLEKIRHFPAKTYSKLMELNDDFGSQGVLYGFVRDSFGLDAHQLDQIVKNTALAAEILSDTCSRQELVFDLEPVEFFKTKDVKPVVLDCKGY